MACIKEFLADYTLWPAAMTNSDEISMRIWDPRQRISFEFSVGQLPLVFLALYMTFDLIWPNAMSATQITRNGLLLLLTNRIALGVERIHKCYNSSLHSPE